LLHDTKNAELTRTAKNSLLNLFMVFKN